jgi:hypothetical protein
VRAARRAASPVTTAAMVVLSSTIFLSNSPLFKDGHFARAPSGSRSQNQQDPASRARERAATMRSR